MAPKTRFRLPALRLQGTMVLAAAAIFTVALGGSTLLVRSIAEQGAIAQGNAHLDSIAEKQSIQVNEILNPYANAATALALTGSALLADPMSARSCIRPWR